MTRRDTGAEFDAVVWVFDPAEQVLTPLASTSRWFEGFPWEPAVVTNRPGSHTVQADSQNDPELPGAEAPEDADVRRH